VRMAPTSIQRLAPRVVRVMGRSAAFGVIRTSIPCVGRCTTRAPSRTRAVGTRPGNVSTFRRVPRHDPPAVTMASCRGFSRSEPGPRRFGTRPTTPEGMGRGTREVTRGRSSRAPNRLWRDPAASRGGRRPMTAGRSRPGGEVQRGPELALTPDLYENEIRFQSNYEALRCSERRGPRSAWPRW